MTIHFDNLKNELSTSSAPVGVVRLSERQGIYRNYFKRMIDIAVIVLAAPIVLPIVALLALLVARDGHAPFYLSRRVGRNGLEFSMVKLRTMVPDADQRLEAYLESCPAARREWQHTQKLKNDPRTTAFGRILRKCSMDELPQLWNVVIGDMSLVGPRPMLPEQRALYSGLSYYALRPGITGPWQISDRNESEFAKRAEHDRFYDQSLSFGTDISILTRTVGVVVRGTGY
jgi:lipopolysaccharide/colanic/teichoic acid biosynthesis glycosyltransferase